jgi:RNA polymerase-associated protein RTF1
MLWAARVFACSGFGIPARDVPAFRVTTRHDATFDALLAMASDDEARDDDDFDVLAAAGSSDDDADDDDFDDGYGSDLMGDAADRARLASLNELEREEIMLERADARKRLESRRAIIAAARSKELELARKKTGARAISSKQRDELEALERIAEAKKRKERSRRVFGDLSEDEEEFGGAASESEDEERVARPRRKKRETRADVDLEAEYASSDVPATRDEIASVTVKRHQLEQWVNEPYFEAAVTNCLTRVGIGLNKEGQNVYRLVEIAGVADGKYKQYSLKKYEYLANKPPTQKWLILRWGKSEKTFRLSEVSNSDVQDAEWKAWVAHCAQAGCTPITARDVKKCLQGLEEAKNYRYTSDDVTKILAEKREKQGTRHNLLFEKEQIKAAIAHAEAENDLDKVEELRQRFDEVDREIKDKLQQRSGSTQDALANINRRNEIQNSEKLSKRASEQVAKLKAGVLNTGSGDPFSRRPTRLTTYWDMGAGAAERSATAAEEEEAAAATAAAPATDGGDEEDDIFLTAGVDAQQSEKELVDVLQQAHRETVGSLNIDLSRLDAPADADALRLKTTKSVLDRGAVLLKSAYDAQRAEQLATQPPGKAFTVAEYLAEFVAPT